MPGGKKTKRSRQLLPNHYRLVLKHLFQNLGSFQPTSSFSSITFLTLIFPGYGGNTRTVASSSKSVARALRLPFTMEPGSLSQGWCLSGLTGWAVRPPMNLLSWFHLGRGLWVLLQLAASAALSFFWNIHRLVPEGRTDWYQCIQMSSRDSQQIPAYGAAGQE